MPINIINCFVKYSDLMRIWKPFPGYSELTGEEKDLGVVVDNTIKVLTQYAAEGQFHAQGH